MVTSQKLISAKIRSFKVNTIWNILHILSFPCFLATRCIFHEGEGESEGKITPFSENSLQKCKQILEVRKHNLAKYHEISLPDSLGGVEGYHKSCYGRFTAISATLREQLKALPKNDTESSPSLTRSKLKGIKSPVVVSNSGILEQLCIFCGKVVRKKNDKRHTLTKAETKEFEDNIKMYMRWREDDIMMAKLQAIGFSVKEVHYHGICRVEYQNEAKLTPIGKRELKKLSENEANDGNSEWHVSRKLHKDAFIRLLSFIDEEILIGKEVVLLSEINKSYQDILNELMGQIPEDFSYYKSSRLENKITEHYKDKIQVIKGKTIRGNLICSKEYTQEEALRKFDKKNVQAKMKDVALMLRNAIFHAPFDALPDDIKQRDISKGEIQAPDILNQFMTYLIGGPILTKEDKTKKLRRTRSISDDIVFAVTSGRKKPAKHLQIGLAMKSLTGSRTVVNILNRLGHCASYNTIEELETELTFATDKESTKLPEGMSQEASLATGLAFDNYDRYIETLSGKGTLHDTVGIAYQLMPSVDGETSTSQVDVASPTCKSRKKRRRAYEVNEESIQPYHKKPKMLTSTFVPMNDVRRKYVPDSLKLAREKDFLWTFNLSQSSRDNIVPMWVGWNAKISKLEGKVNNKQQQVCYLPQINESPTSVSVVAETMKRSQAIAEECNKSSISVTYDLAIAKIAMQLQSTESPKYDNLFINLGGFHIEMAFFAAMGKYVSDSGGPHIINETHVLEKGSMVSFISGKGYNRCKRIHQLFAASMEILHFEAYIAELENTEEHMSYETMRADLHTILDNPSSLERYQASSEFREIIDGYKTYAKKTEDGEHGKTAQYWYGYIRMVQLYHDYTRSIREGDFQLYIYCLPKLSDYFFGFNHINYAKWLVRFHDNLLKLNDTHPEVYNEFTKGCFGIQRTTKRFSRIPIDLTLEQTINADAASQKSGIIPFTNSISARQRWAKSHFIRTQVISDVFEMLDMSKKEDVSKDLHPNRARKNTGHMLKLLETIPEHMNPFSKDLDKEILYNLGTGKSAQIETADFLLSVVKIGRKAQTDFINECIEDPARFEKPLAKQKICNFAKEQAQYRLRGADNKIVAVEMMRDLFGSILVVSMQRKIDMAQLLTYPLTPVPLSLCHTDGTMQKTPKSKLLAELEKRAISCMPSFIDVKIIDAMFFLHLCKEVPESFGALSRFILAKTCAEKGKEIHLVFDKVVKPSIKDAERDKRAGSLARSSSFHISGPSQKRQGNWLKNLRQDEFKTALNKFLVQDWERDEYANVLKDKKIFITLDNRCFSFFNDNGKIVKSEVLELRSSHEEADSKMIFHLMSIPPNKSAVLRCYDADIAMIALANLVHLQKDVRVWMELGLYSNNSLRYLYLTQLYQKLGLCLCLALLVLHALTGCDYTASFARKGKVRPLKLLEKRPKTQEVFGAIARSEELTEEDVREVESFVCAMYGHPKLASIDEVRFELFQKKYSPKKNQDPINCVRKMDGSCLPPCLSVLKQKILRTKFISHIWFSAFLPDPPSLSPEDYGWTLEDNCYRIKWFDGDATPAAIDMVCPDDDIDDEASGSTSENDNILSKCTQTNST